MVHLTAWYHQVMTKFFDFTIYGPGSPHKLVTFKGAVHRPASCSHRPACEVVHLFYPATKQAMNITF